MLILQFLTCFYFHFVGLFLLAKHAEGAAIGKDVGWRKSDLEGPRKVDLRPPTSAPAMGWTEC